MGFFMEGGLKTSLKPPPSSGWAFLGITGGHSFLVKSKNKNVCVKTRRFSLMLLEKNIRTNCVGASMIFKWDMSHKFNITTGSLSGHHLCHIMTRDPLWYLQMSPFKLSDMSLTIEGPAAWFCVSEGLRAQCASRMDWMDMWHFCNVSATVTSIPISTQSPWLVSNYICPECWCLTVKLLFVNAGNELTAVKPRLSSNWDGV